MFCTTHHGGQFCRKQLGFAFEGTTTAEYFFGLLVSAAACGVGAVSRRQGGSKLETRSIERENDREPYSRPYP